MPNKETRECIVCGEEITLQDGTWVDCTYPNMTSSVVVASLCEDGGSHRPGANSQPPSVFDDLAEMAPEEMESIRLALFDLAAMRARMSSMTKSTALRGHGLSDAAIIWVLGQ